MSAEDTTAWCTQDDHQALEERHKQHRQIRLENGRFTNPWDSWIDRTPWDGLKWVVQWRRQRHQLSDQEQAMLRVKQVKLKRLHAPQDTSALQVTWLGHSSTLIQCDNLTVLTDPTWAERCSSLGPLRVVDPPLSITDLPPIHCVLISHAHYDHFDLDTVLELEWRHRPMWCVPQNFCNSFFCASPGLQRAVREKRCIECDWWKEHSLLDGRLQVVGLPAQHYSNRTVFDLNQVHWASYGLRFTRIDRRVYFAGDTGYCSAFQCIGRCYGPFDLALLPIGAYEPRALLHCQHINPEEAVRIHRDVRAHYSLGIHWGTWMLSNESLFAPLSALQEALQQHKLEKDRFRTLPQGKTLRIGKKEP